MLHQVAGLQRHRDRRARPLGIGANTAIFQRGRCRPAAAVALSGTGHARPLAREDAIFESSSVSYPNYLDWRAMQRSFTDLALYRRDSMNLSSRGEESPPERVGAES